MKIFDFDPTTGKRGEQIDNVRIASWTAQSVKWQVDHGTLCPIEFVQPADDATHKYTVHIDAGFTNKYGVHETYRKRDKWIMFCLGEWMTGEPHGIWEWIILPPSKLIEHT